MLKKLMSVLLILSFTLSTTCFDTAHALNYATAGNINLAPALLFNDLNETEQTDTGRIFMALESCLQRCESDDARTLLNNLKELSESPEDTDWLFASDKARFLFAEANELTAGIGYVRCDILNPLDSSLRIYYIGFGLTKDENDGYPLEVYTEKEWNDKNIPLRIEAKKTLVLREGKPASADTTQIPAWARNEYASRVLLTMAMKDGITRARDFNMDEFMATYNAVQPLYPELAFPKKDAEFIQKISSAFETLAAAGLLSKVAQEDMVPRYSITLQGQKEIMSLKNTWAHKSKARNAAPVTKPASLFRESLSYGFNVLRLMISKVKFDFSLGLSASAAKRQMSSLAMFPSFVTTPTGRETGTYLAIDIGGSNFRVLAVKLDGNRKIEVLADTSKDENFDSHVPEEIKTGEAKDLFDYIARNVHDFMKKNGISTTDTINLGCTWSYPVQQTSINSGIHMKWVKGWNVKGVVGNDVGKLLSDAFVKEGIGNVNVAALCNDTVGTLAAGRYMYSDCDMGVILGTGTNAAMVLNLDEIAKWSGEKAYRQMIVNAEWGNFYGVNRTDFDDLLDKDTKSPGVHQFEKMISGKYLGEIARRVLIGAINENALFGGVTPEKLLEVLDEEDDSKGFQSAWVSMIENDGTADLETAGKIFMDHINVTTTLEERRLIKDICTAVSERAARMSAAAIGATVEMMDPRFERDHVIAIDGSLFEHNVNFKKNMEAALKELYAEKSDKIKLILIKDGSGVGAAVIAAIAASASQPAAPLPVREELARLGASAAAIKDANKIIIVPGHGVYKGTSSATAEDDDSWVGIFPGEGKFYIEHVRGAVELAAARPGSVIVFSGGQSREKAGNRSESESYHEIARQYNWWGHPEVAGRILQEEYSRDSMENVLFSVELFNGLTGKLPGHVTVTGWDFKSERFGIHANGIGIPAEDFEYVGVNDPEPAALAKAQIAERKLVEDTKNNPLLRGADWDAKRATRDPFRRGNPYGDTEDLAKAISEGYQTSALLPQDVKPLAKEAGRLILSDTMKNGMYTLLLPFEFYKNAEFRNDASENRSRFILKRVGVTDIGTTTDLAGYVRDLIAEAGQDAGRSVALIPKKLIEGRTEHDIEMALEPLATMNMKFIVGDVAAMQEMETAMAQERKFVRQDTYAIMLLARAVTPDMDKNSPIVRYLEYLVEKYFKWDGERTIKVAEYIAAIANSEILKIVKAYVIPAEQMDARLEHERSSYTLIYA